MGKRQRGPREDALATAQEADGAVAATAKAAPQRNRRRRDEASGADGAAPARRSRQERRARRSGPARVRDAGEPLVVFVHIPKTAGLTVSSLLAGAFSKEAVWKAGNFFKGPEKTEGKLARFSSSDVGQRKRLAVGHIPIGIYERHLDAGDLRYMTFLRDPVDRVLSHYYRHVQMRRPGADADRAARRRARAQRGAQAADPLQRRSERSTPRHAYIASSLDDALDQHFPVLENLQVRYLCGVTTADGDLPPDALERAKAKLETFAFVGVTERFDESVVLLLRQFGLELRGYASRHVNAARPAAEEVSDEQRARIAALNALDVELYEFGRTLFEQQRAAYGDALGADLDELQRLNAAAAEAADDDEEPDATDDDAAMPLSHAIDQ